MSKFVITFPDGTTQEVTTPHESVEDFVNSHFGPMWHGAHGAMARGTKVEMFVDGASAEVSGDAPAHQGPETPRVFDDRVIVPDGPQ